MQTIPKQLFQWTKKWQLQFNADKCKFLHLGQNNRCVIYKMRDSQLQSSVTEKDLGVYDDEELFYLDEDTIPRLSGLTWRIATSSGFTLSNGQIGSRKSSLSSNEVSITPETPVIWRVSSCPETPIYPFVRWWRHEIQAYKIMNWTAST